MHWKHLLVDPEECKDFHQFGRPFNDWVEKWGRQTEAQNP